MINKREMVWPTYDEKNASWWEVMTPIQPCEWGSRLKDEGSEDLDVVKEVTIYITHEISILIWLKDDPFSSIVISS